MANINEYRSRIKLYKRSYTSNDMGGYSQSLILVATLWSKIEDLGGKEQLLFNKVSADKQYKISIRYRSDINPDMKVLYNKKYFNIITPPIDVGNYHDELQLICEVEK